MTQANFPFQTRGRIMAPVLLTQLAAPSEPTALHLVVMSFDGYLYMIDGASGAIGRSVDNDLHGGGHFRRHAHGDARAWPYLLDRTHLLPRAQYLRVHAFSHISALTTTGDACGAPGAVIWQIQ